MPKTKNLAMSINAVDILSKEVVIEGTEEYEAILDNLNRVKPGTERHSELLCDLWTQAWIIKNKAQAVVEAIDEYMESLPDDDD